MVQNIFTIIFFFLGFNQLNAQHINGVCIVGSFEETSNSVINEIYALNSNWISLSPEAVLDRTTLQLDTELENTTWSNTLEGYREIINGAKAKGQKVLLKPHMVVDKQRNGVNEKLIEEVTWRGDVVPKSYWDWKIFDESYRSYILEMATFAQAEEIEMFCLGTELKTFIEARPKFWKKLIAGVREVYTGQLIYSANWDNYKNIPFWDDLDYIGINGYFPISKEEQPTTKQTQKNWSTIKFKLKNFCKKHGKKLIFTEFGYRNVPYAGLEPWTHNNSADVANLESVQYNLLEAFFLSLWKEDWVEGGFLWNWNYKPLPKGNTDFSIQNKPALNLVKQFYTDSL